jgi:hypothetical protein
VEEKLEPEDLLEVELVAPLLFLLVVWQGAQSEGLLELAAQIQEPAGRKQDLAVVAHVFQRLV